jgi:hypothetical protein
MSSICDLSLETEMMRPYIGGEIESLALRAGGFDAGPITHNTLRASVHRLVSVMF